MPELRSGAVTFLFTDIEGSSRLWEADPTPMADALARHDQLCRATVTAHGGKFIKMVGDGLHAVFDEPAAAAATALDLQIAISRAQPRDSRKRSTSRAASAIRRSGR